MKKVLWHNTIFIFLHTKQYKHLTNLVGDLPLTGIAMTKVLDNTLAIKQVISKASLSLHCCAFQNHKQVCRNHAIHSNHGYHKLMMVSLSKHVNTCYSHLLCYWITGPISINLFWWIKKLSNLQSWLWNKTIKLILFMYHLLKNPWWHYIISYCRICGKLLCTNG